MILRKAKIEQLESRVVLTSNLASFLTSIAASGYTADGSGNNLVNLDWGSAGTDLARAAPAAYGDGISTPAGADRPSPREISNALSDQEGVDVISDRLLSAMTYAWGQFIDHDLDLTPNGSTPETFSISIPAGDAAFDPIGSGTQVLPFHRSAYDFATGVTSPREQVNVVTSWLDGSMIYGSDPVTAAALRTGVGGKLKTSGDDLLPRNDASTFPEGPVFMANDAHLVSDDQMFVAGDVRANENIELTALHTIFVREHNYWAQKTAAANPTLSDEEIYQQARTVVAAEIQSITFNEWLPAILGGGTVATYAGYDPGVNPAISNEFSTAAFRFGHSLLGDDVEFLDNQGLPIADEVPLSGAFFNPDLVSDTNVSAVLKYLVSDPASELDTQVVDSVRNFLFGPPGSGGLDLVSLNLQRGRDHGLADYNSVRVAYGLPSVEAFSDITSDAALAAKLQSLYGLVDNIDLWVGAVAEDHLSGASVGPTLQAIVAGQFTRLRDGDRFWYQNQSAEFVRWIEGTSMADIIRRNTEITNVQDNAFFFDSTISGKVFVDANRDGRLNRQESRAAGVVVSLVDNLTGDVVATSTTDRNGWYQFDVASGLRTGQYRVVVNSSRAFSSTQPASVAITRGDQSPHVDIALRANRPSRPHRGNPARSTFTATPRLIDAALSIES